MRSDLAEPTTHSITTQLLKDKIILSLIDRLRCFRGRILEIEDLSNQGFETHREEYYKLSDLSQTYRDSLSRRIIEVLDDAIRHPENVMDLLPVPESVYNDEKSNASHSSNEDAADGSTLVSASDPNENMTTTTTNEGEGAVEWNNSEEVSTDHDQAALELDLEENLSNISQSTECDAGLQELVLKSDVRGRYYSFTTLSGHSRKFYVDGLSNEINFRLNNLRDFPMWVYSVKCFLERNCFDSLLTLKRHVKLPSDQNCLLVSLLNKSLDRRLSKYLVFRHCAIELINQLWDQYESADPAKVLAEEWSRINISLGCSDVHFAEVCLSDMLHREMFSYRNQGLVDERHINFMIMNSLSEDLRLYLNVFDVEFDQYDLGDIKPKSLIKLIVDSIRHYRKTLPNGISPGTRCRICLSKLHGTKSCKSRTVTERLYSSSSASSSLSDHVEDPLEKPADKKEKEKKSGKYKERGRKKLRKRHVRNKSPNKDGQMHQRTIAAKVN